MEMRIITIPLDAYRSESNAEVKDTGGINNEYALDVQCLKTLTDERSHKRAHAQ
jgi:hypothetical protein